MATRNICPRATGEGSVGIVGQKWGEGYYNALYSGTLTLTDAMTNTGQPAFLGVKTSPTTNFCGDSVTYTVTYSSEVFDQGSHFNPSTGTFTAPLTGRYQLQASVLIGNFTSSHTRCDLYITTSNRTYLVAQNNPYATQSGVNSVAINGSVLADMDAGDTALIQIYVSASTKTVTLYGAASPNTLFSGFLVA